MNYLISRCQDNIILDTGDKIEPNIKYECDVSSPLNIIYNDISYVVNIRESKSVLRVGDGLDNYYFFNLSLVSEVFSTFLKHKNYIISIHLGMELIVSIDGEVVVSMRVSDIEYSHHEVIGDLCILLFEGKRKLIVIINNNEFCCASYYDEYNEDDNERYYMCRLYDSLNHGKVHHIKDKKYDSYLVYLDDEELNLKSELVGHIFLDCILARNFKYCNNLLSKDIQQDNVENLKLFFPEFDSFYSLSEDKFALFKKNTLSGIYRFDILGTSITNIIEWTN